MTAPAGNHDRTARAGTRLPARIRRLREFVSDTVWDIETSGLSVRRRFGIKFARVVHLVLSGFRDDECPLHASALTFSTLMSIVPVLALSLFIARGFGAGEILQEKIRHFVDTQLRQLEDVSILHRDTPEPSAEAAPADDTASAPNDAGPRDVPPAAETEDIVAQIDHLVDQIFSYANNVNFAALGGVGLALLIWSVINTLGEVEYAFNRVWGVTVPRSIPRKLSDYLGVVVLTPVLLLLCSSLPVIAYIQSYLHALLPGPLADFLNHLLDARLLKHLTVLALVSLSFALFIMIMPNTRVRFAPAMVGGVIAALLFVAWMWVCVKLEVGAVRAGKIYGSFAVVPIVLLWVLISWQITLFGAEVTFAVQNCGTFRMEQPARRASMESCIVLAVNIVAQAAQALQEDKGVFDAAAYARARNVPVRLLNEVLGELTGAGILAEVAGRPETFVLLRAPDRVRVADIVTALLKSGIDPVTLGLGGLAGDLEGTLNEVRQNAVAAMRETAPREEGPPAHHA